MDYDYGGIDVSIAPSTNPMHSIPDALDTVGLGKFGNLGSVTVISIVTSALKQLPVKVFKLCKPYIRFVDILA